MSKQLMPAYDKPMIYYPLSTFVMAGVRDFLVITTPEDRGQFQRLLGDGSHLGLRVCYSAQQRPEGIAQAFLIGADFIGEDQVALILGDNICHGAGLGRELRRCTAVRGGRIFACPVAEPEHYAVVELDSAGQVVAIEEKPARPRSRYAVTGLYFYDRRVVEVARGLRPARPGS